MNMTVEMYKMIDGSQFIAVKINTTLLVSTSKGAPSNMPQNYMYFYQGVEMNLVSPTCRAQKRF